MTPGHVARPDDTAPDKTHVVRQKRLPHLERNQKGT
jgi:hypothetical protein